MAELIISAFIWIPVLGLMCWACYKAGYSKGKRLGMEEAITSH